MQHRLFSDAVAFSDSQSCPDYIRQHFLSHNPSIPSRLSLGNMLTSHFDRNIATSLTIKRSDIFSHIVPTEGSRNFRCAMSLCGFVTQQHIDPASKPASSQHIIDQTSSERADHQILTVLDRLTQARTDKVLLR
jgi:hypothetical protein